MKYLPGDLLFWVPAFAYESEKQIVIFVSEEWNFEFAIRKVLTTSGKVATISQAGRLFRCE